MRHDEKLDQFSMDPTPSQFLDKINLHKLEAEDQIDFECCDKIDSSSDVRLCTCQFSESGIHLQPATEENNCFYSLCSCACDSESEKSNGKNFEENSLRNDSHDLKSSGTTTTSRTRMNHFTSKYFTQHFIFLLLLSTAIKAVAHPEDWNDSEDEFSFYGIRSKRSDVVVEGKGALNLKETDEFVVIPADYNFHEPPPNNGEATKVEFSVLIVNVRDIKELNEELSMEMNLRMYWKDARLSHLSNMTVEAGSLFMVLNPMIIDRIWHPDIFIDHVKSISQPSLITKPASLRVYPGNLIRYSSRITANMACQMDFHYYPADTQYCHVDMKSYAYTNRVMGLEWKEGRGAFLVDKLILPNFDVVLDTTQNFTVATSSGTYAGIRFTVILRRMLSYHLIQTYLPSTLFIVVSWMSFLVPPESVPGRMALCMTTLLTLTAMFSAVRQNTPNVSYVKALDIWMVVCIIFVFLTLMEYTIILKLRSMKVKATHKKKEARFLRNRIRHIPQKIASFYAEFPKIQFRRQKVAQDTTFTEHNETNGHQLANGGNGVGAADTIGSTYGKLNNENGQNGSPKKEVYTISSANTGGQTSSRRTSVLPTTKDGLTRYDLAVIQIEKFTSTVIPGLFFVFNLAYWPWLLVQAQYYRHYELDPGTAD